MREIKFRAWDSKRKRLKVLKKITIKEKGFVWRNELFEFDGHNAIMQFTGLKDKNGKEIFEEDIVKYKNSIWTVRFVSGGFDIFADAKNLSVAIGEKSKTDNEMIADELNVWWTRCEVIGNEFENPELLNRCVKDSKSVEEKN